MGTDCSCMERVKYEKKEKNDNFIREFKPLKKKLNTVGANSSTNSPFLIRNDQPKSSIQINKINKKLQNSKKIIKKNYEKDHLQKQPKKKFFIGTLIGIGTKGNSYELYDFENKNEKYVVKVLKLKENENVKLCKTYFLQSKLFKLENENILKYVKIIQGENDPSSLWLISDYFDGINLREFIKKNGDFTEKHVRIIASNLLRALDYLHSCSIYHGNLNFKNILINQNLQLKIKGIVETPKNLINSSVFDKKEYQYIAPECFNNKKKELKNDVWSYGCIIFELISGKKPWGNLTFFEIKEKIENNEGVSFPSHVPDNFKEFLASCLIISTSSRTSIKDLLLDPIIYK